MQIDITPIEESYKIILGTNPEFNPIIEAGKIQISIMKEDIPDLIRKLSNQNYNIYSIEKIKESLEDKYLEITNQKE